MVIYSVRTSRAGIPRICGHERVTSSVKEIFYTLQGEGANTGRPAVFCRFAGCNLWSGRERHRASAVCRFCDTDFVGTAGIRGGKYSTADDLSDQIAQHWPSTTLNNRFTVLTGGEPLLQVDEQLIAALKKRDFVVAVETNGTVSPPPGLDWICVSPKAGTRLVVEKGNELKFIYPQSFVDPAEFLQFQFDFYYLQPMDGLERESNTAAAIVYCMQHPVWRLSTQTHKFLGIP